MSNRDLDTPRSFKFWLWCVKILPSKNLVRVSEVFYGEDIHICTKKSP